MYLRQRTRHSVLGANLHLHYDVQYLSILIELGEHHNGPTLPVIDHLPEVPACGLQGTLGYDERLLLLVAIDGYSMDIVWMFTLEENTPAVSW